MNVTSFTWNGKTFCARGGKTVKYWKEVFIMGTGWTKEPCTKEEYQSAADDLAKALGRK